VEWLESQPEIVLAGIAESGEGIWYLLDSGLLGGIILHPEGTEAARINHANKKSLYIPELNFKINKSILGVDKISGFPTSITEGSNPRIGSKNIWFFSHLVGKGLNDF